MRDLRRLAKATDIDEATVVPATAVGPKGDRSVLELTFDPKHRPTGGADLDCAKTLLMSK